MFRPIFRNKPSLTAVEARTYMLFWLLVISCAFLEIWSYFEMYGSLLEIRYSIVLHFHSKAMPPFVFQAVSLLYTHQRNCACRRTKLLSSSVDAMIPIHFNNGNGRRTWSCATQSLPCVCGPTRAAPYPATHAWPRSGTAAPHLPGDATTCGGRLD